MEQERRGTVRRQSDRLFQKTLRFNRIILDLLLGVNGDFGKILYGVSQLNLNIGRRKRDRETAENLADGLQAILTHLVKLGIIEGLPRKVLLTKVHDNLRGYLPMGEGRVGWEEKFPKLGERYRIVMDNGRKYWTSSVKDCSGKQIRTRNSIYFIDVLEESYMVHGRKRKQVCS